MATATVAPPPAPGVENQTPFRENLNLHLICPDCKINPPDLVEENADYICANCGRVLEERLVSYESEWRTFNNDEKGGDDPNRVGDAENDLLFGNQGTVIGGSGPNVSKQSRILRRVQQMQNEDKNNRALQSAYNQIDSWAESEHFTSTVKQTAKGYYKQVYEKGMFRGKNHTAVLAGCLFISCRSNNVPRSFAELMNLTKVPKKEIGRIFKQLNNFFQDQSESTMNQIEDEGGIVNRDALGFKQTGSSKPSVLVGRYCGMLGMPFRIQAISTKLAEKMTTISSLAGRSPLSTASACIYFASHLLGKGKSLAEISTVSNVSDATIKQAYKKLYEHKDKLIEPDWLGPQPTTVRDQIRETLVGDVDKLPKAN